MHEERIVEDILSGITASDYELKAVWLTAEEQVLIGRLEGDIALGHRTEDVKDRSLERLRAIEQLDYRKIDTTNLTIERVVEEIIKL